MRHFLQIYNFSLIHDVYVYIDLEDYVADNLFIKHNVRVTFVNEYKNEDYPNYRVIFVKVKKWDRQKFLDAMSELPSKMMICGDKYYLPFCHKYFGKLTSIENYAG